MMKKEDLRIIFYGSTEFSVATLKAMCERNWIVEAVVTNPDQTVRRHGRDFTIPNPVKEYADQQSITVLQPQNLKDPSFLETLQDLQPNLQVVVAFKILPKEVWSLPAYGTINLHPSRLPLYKGPAPIPWSIVRGEDETCITAFFLSDDGVDSGKPIAQSDPVSLILSQDEVESTTDILQEMQDDIIPQFIDSTLTLILDREGRPRKIPRRSIPLEESYAPKLTRENTRIDWERSWTGIELHRFIQGMGREPGAWSTLQGKEIKILSSCGIIQEAGPEYDFIKPGTLIKRKKQGIYLVANKTDLVHLGEVQLEGKRAMQATEFWNGLDKKKSPFRLGS